MPFSRGVLGLVLFVGLLGLSIEASPNGGKGKITRLYGELSVPAAAGAEGSGAYEFSADVENVMFRLMTFKERYRVIRLKIVNRNAAPLVLSPQQDRATLMLSDGLELEAVLDLSDNDLWEELSDSARAWLAYPISVETEEEENVFLLFDVAAIEGVPIEIILDLGSTEDMIVMAAPVAAH